MKEYYYTESARTFKTGKICLMQMLILICTVCLYVQVKHMRPVRFGSTPVEYDNKPLLWVYEQKKCQQCKNESFSQFCYRVHKLALTFLHYSQPAELQIENPLTLYLMYI